MNLEDNNDIFTQKPDEEEKKLLLNEEEALWNKVIADPENSDPHKRYVGHVLRYGFLKEGSRRYGPIVDDPKYSIAARRLARYYQKQIVNLMFITPKETEGQPKSRALGYILVFMSMMLFLTGILADGMAFLSFGALLFLVPYIILKAMQAKSKSDKLKQKTDRLGKL